MDMDMFLVMEPLVTMDMATVDMDILVLDSFMAKLV